MKVFFLCFTWFLSGHVGASTEEVRDIPESFRLHHLLVVSFLRSELSHESPLVGSHAKHAVAKEKIEEFLKGFSGFTPIGAGFAAHFNVDSVYKVNGRLVLNKSHFSSSAERRPYYAGDFYTDGWLLSRCMSVKDLLVGLCLSDIKSESDISSYCGQAVLRISTVYSPMGDVVFYLFDNTPLRLRSSLGLLENILKSREVEEDRGEEEEKEERATHSVSDLQMMEAFSRLSMTDFLNLLGKKSEGDN